MVSYRITFTVNGRRTEEIVNAVSQTSAKSIIRDKYSGAIIRFISTKIEK